MLSKNTLIRLINHSFGLDKSISVTEQHLAELEAIEANANGDKFKLK